MSALFSSPVLRIEQQSSQLEYRIADQHDRPIGRATQVAGRRPRKGPLGWLLGSGLGNARTVIQVFGADDAPLFYVDYQGGKPPAGGAPPAVVALDGTVIGRLVHDRLGVAQDMAAGGALAGMARMTFGAPSMRHRLEDARDRAVCRLDWTLRRAGDAEQPRWVPVACDYLDMNGSRIAHADIHQATFKDRYVLHLGYQLPEPLRTLVIASPLAYDLSQS